MPTLDELTSTRPDFDLDSLVRQTNALLPDYLPDEAADARVKGEVNARLVRHYTSAGLLEPPLKEGREARYTIDHLLQLLALRRLLADGVSTAAIGESLRKKEREELRSIVEGGARVDFAPAADQRSAALSFIEHVRRRKSGHGEVAASIVSEDAQSAPSSHSSSPPRQSTSVTPSASSWERYQLLDGVELHVRNDVKVPTKAEAQRRLLDHITRLIVQIAQRRMR